MTTIFDRDRLVVQDRSLEWLCSCLMLAWAVTLVLPGDTLALPAFAGFRTLGVAFWTGAFGIVGGGRMAALIINGRWPRSARVRQIGAFLGAFFWVQIAILIYGAHRVGAPWGPNIPICAVLAAFELLSLRRAAFDGRYYHR